MNEYYLEIESDEKPILYSDNQKPKRTRDTKKNKKLRLYYIIAFIIIIYLFYEPILKSIMELIALNPTVYKLYLAIEYQIVNNTLTGLFYISILGSLFCLAIPSEAIFIYYLSSTTHNWLFILSIIVIGNTLGLIFNYSFGRILGEKIIQVLFKKNFEKYKERIDKYGGFVLFFGNIFPGPIELLTVFYGGFKFKFSTYIYLSFMGRLIKYVILIGLYIFFWEQLTLLYGDFLLNLEALKQLYI